MNLKFNALIFRAATTVSIYYGVGKVQGNVNEMSIYIKDISETIDQYDLVVSEPVM